MRRHRCLAVCAPGLEDLCAGELGGLGVRLRRTLVGGVEFSASERQLYAANMWSRTATRVIVRCSTFPASTFAELEHGASEVPWECFVAPGTSPVVRVSATSSRLYHTGAVAERLAELAGTGTGTGPLLVVRIIHDRVTLSIDSSGDPLFQRGWRLETARAPMRETLAAAVVMASGWDRRSPLVDPFCGSGTIAIEAALLASGRAPGSGRRFGFQAWPAFEPGTWASVAAEVGNATVAPQSPSPCPVVIAADRDAGAVRATRANAERAGVADLIDVRRGSLSELDVAAGNGAAATARARDATDRERAACDPAHRDAADRDVAARDAAAGSVAAGERGWVVTNPPYGKRTSGGGDLRDLYASIGSVARDRLSGWEVTLLVAERAMAERTGLRFHERFRTANGGIPVRCLSTRVPRG